MKMKARKITRKKIENGPVCKDTGDLLGRNPRRVSF